MVVAVVVFQWLKFSWMYSVMVMAVVVVQWLKFSWMYSVMVMAVVVVQWLKFSWMYSVMVLAVVVFQWLKLSWITCVFLLYGPDVLRGEVPVVGQFLPVGGLELLGGQLPQDLLHLSGVRVLGLAQVGVWIHIAHVLIVVVLQRMETTL